VTVPMLAEETVSRLSLFCRFGQCGPVLPSLPWIVVEYEDQLMERRRRIVLFGNSVILGAVGTSLQRFPQNEVIPASPEVREAADVAALKPDVVLFDLASSIPQPIFSLLESFPGMKLIGVSPDSNVVRIWSGKQLHELSTQGLMDVMSEPFHHYRDNRMSKEN